MTNRYPLPEHGTQATSHHGHAHHGHAHHGHAHSTQDHHSQVYSDRVHQHNGHHPQGQIVLDNVTKKFGRTTAIDHTSATIPLGRVYGLIGRNGAGKSTLLAAIAGQLITKGSITIAGQPVVDNRQILDQLILAGVDSNMPTDVSLKTLISIARARWETFDLHYAHQLAGDYGLDMSKRIKSMSRGQKSLASVVIGLAAQCPITLLDEPYLGLDVQNRQQFYRHLLEDLERNPRTVIVSTHHIDDAEKILDSVILLDQGRVTGVGDLESIRQRVLILTGSATAVDAALSASGISPKAIVNDSSAVGARRVVLDVGVEGSFHSSDAQPQTHSAPAHAVQQRVDRVRAACERSGVRVAEPHLEQAVLALTGRDLQGLDEHSDSKGRGANGSGSAAGREGVVSDG